MPTNWGARSFNGTSSDQIACGSATTGWSSGATWSASAWFKPAVLPSSGNFMTILAKRNAASAMFEIFIENVAGTTGFGAYNGTVFKAFGTISTGSWINGVATCDATSAIIYLNGSSAGTDAQNYTTGTGTNTPLTIGFDNSGGSNIAVDFFNGAIADVAIWTGVKLTAAEALSLSQGVRPYNIRRGSLQSWWPLDGLQSPEADLISARNGVVSGTAIAFGPPYAPLTPRWPQISFPLIFTSQTFQPAWAMGSRKVNDGVGI